MLLCSICHFSKTAYLWVSKTHKTCWCYNVCMLTLWKQHLNRGIFSHLLLKNNLNFYNFLAKVQCFCIHPLTYFLKYLSAKFYEIVMGNTRAFLKIHSQFFVQLLMCRIRVASCILMKILKNCWISFVLNFSFIIFQQKTKT